MIDWHYWTDRARELRKKQKFNEAIECYERILQYNPEDAFALAMIGACYSDMGQTDTALEYTQRALDINSRDYFLWYSKGMVYFNSRQYWDAAGCFERATSINPANAASWYFKGLCHYNLEEIEKAVECLEKSYEINSNEETLNFINDLKRKSGTSNDGIDIQIKAKPDANTKKHFNSATVCFDYPGNYMEDVSDKYKEMGIIASFKAGSAHNFDSAFAVFSTEPVSAGIADSTFRKVIEGMDSDILDINRYTFNERERVIIRAKNRSNANTEYRCSVSQIGLSVLFVIPSWKEHLFDEKYVSTVVNSLERLGSICPYCGGENPPDVKYCMKCGIMIEDENR